MILQDLAKLQVSASADIFGIGGNLFLMKWKETEPAFVAYFEKQWLCDLNKNWFEGATEYDPKTAWKASMLILKMTSFFRETATMRKFQNNIFDMLHRLSDEYRDGEKQIKNNVEISKTDWLNGYNWTILKAQVHEIKSKSNLNKVFFLFHISKSKCHS